MGRDQIGIDELRVAVEEAPNDCFNRCNLACALASSGAIDEALLQLAAAAGRAHSQISAGCVASAIRDVADSFAQTWSLPTTGPALPPSPDTARTLAQWLTASSSS